MSFNPSDIGKIEKPSQWKLQQEGEQWGQWGERNPAWRGGVTKDMKAYQKKYKERLKAEQVEMFYQIQFEKRRMSK